MSGFLSEENREAIFKMVVLLCCVEIKCSRDPEI